MSNADKPRPVEGIVGPFGRQGFKTAQEALNDAKKTTNVTNFVLMKNEVHGEFAWGWPPEYWRERFKKSSEVVEVEKPNAGNHGPA